MSSLTDTGFVLCCGCEFNLIIIIIKEKCLYMKSCQMKAEKNTCKCLFQVLMNAVILLNNRRNESAA